METTALKPRLLVVEDDPAMLELITENLAQTYEVTATSDPDIAFRMATQNPPDAMLVDIHLGCDDGLALCARLRQNLLAKEIPIVVVTGVGGREALMRTYDAGADDYLEKPLDLQVLELRLRARIKRVEQLVPRATAIGNLRLYADRSEVELNGKSTHLSQTEFALLKLLLSNANRSVTRDEIMQALWSETHVGHRTIDVHVSSLRRKLRGFDFSIVSLYGRGYILRRQAC